MAQTQFLLGKNLQFSITPQTVDAGGNWSNGTAIAMAGRVESASITPRNETEELSAIDATGANHVAVLTDCDLELGELVLNTANGSAALRALGQSSYVKVVVVLGLASTFTLYGVISQSGLSLSRNRITGSLSVQRSEIGVTNPSWT